jgi:hypothetical protein
LIGVWLEDPLLTSPQLLKPPRTADSGQGRNC